MNHVIAALLVSGLVLFVGCNGLQRESLGADNSPKLLGLLKVTVEGIAEGSVPTASAKFVAPHEVFGSRVASQAASVIPVNGTPALGDVQLLRRTVSFVDDDQIAKRYVSATFDLTNRTALNFSNLTLYAVHVPGNVGGTALVRLSAADGVNITNEGVARGFKPTHGMRATRGGLEVSPALADLQFFTPDEVDHPSGGIKQQAVALGILPATASVLEYGFVAANLSGGRGITARNTGLDCTIPACKGVVTLAYELPKVSPRKDNPLVFSLYFVVADESVSVGSQSPQEQVANTAMGLEVGSLGGFAQIRTLAGSSYDQANLYPVCRVKTAVPTVLNPSGFYLGPDPIPGQPGSLDVCFGVNGLRAMGGDGIALQSDGKIVVVSSVSNGSDLDFEVLRFLPNGALDPSFGTGGRVVTDFASRNDFVGSVAVQADGKLVVVGTSRGLEEVFGIDINKVALARYNPNGTLDPTFDGDGKSITDALRSPYLSSGSVAIQPDGKIVVAGTTGASPVEPYIFIIRYHSGGSLDSSFDGDGVMDNGSVRYTTRSLQVLPSGKIMVVGHTRYTLFAERHTVDGQLDPTFGGSGIVGVAPGPITGMQGMTSTSMAVQPDGKILITGYGTVGSNDGLGFGTVARIDPNGQLDPTFDGDGMVRLDFSSSGESANAVLVLPSGKLLVFATDNNASVLIRLNPDGSFDTSYGAGGKVSSALGATGGGAVALQEDGKVLVGGGVLGRMYP